MPEQSSRHIMLIEPAAFYANPETMDTNPYQQKQTGTKKGVLHGAVAELRDFHNELVENGVMVTVARGRKDCPDHIFPNWVSTHENREMVLYPMLNENRRAERTPELINGLKRFYDVKYDLTGWEDKGWFLESTGSIVMDRVNKIGYAGLSSRTHPEAVAEWGRMMGYEMVSFETRSHVGEPIYHTDLVIFLGTTIAGVAAGTITPEYREKVVGRLSETHEILEITPEQQQSFCGNALEVVGEDGEKMFVLSETAFSALTEVQKEQLHQHFSRILHVPLPVIESYGGGSARCLMLELF